LPGSIEIATEHPDYSSLPEGGARGRFHGFILWYKVIDAVMNLESIEEIIDQLRTER